MENSIYLSGYDTILAFRTGVPGSNPVLVQILFRPYTSARHLFICFFDTGFVCKTMHLFSGEQTQRNHIFKIMCSKILLCTCAVHLLPFNPFPNDNISDWTKLKEFADDDFKFDKHCRKFSKREAKRLWEKEKLLVTSNFSFTHSVFRRLEL